MRLQARAERQRQRQGGSRARERQERERWGGEGQGKETATGRKAAGAVECLQGGAQGGSPLAHAPPQQERGRLLAGRGAVLLLTVLTLLPPLLLGLLEGEVVVVVVVVAMGIHVCHSAVHVNPHVADEHHHMVGVRRHAVVVSGQGGEERSTWPWKVPAGRRAQQESARKEGTPARDRENEGRVWACEPRPEETSWTVAFEGWRGERERSAGRQGRVRRALGRGQKWGR